MDIFTFQEIRLIISNSYSNENKTFTPQLTSRENQPNLSHRCNLVKTIKTYIKKYCTNDHEKNNILFLSITYLDVILKKNKICLSVDKNLKYLCLCCFLISLKFIGNYNISKKIISNFCHNYKDEYKIFEAQCLLLLEHNLYYTTAFDYLNMILSKNNKKLFNLSLMILNKLCEDNIYVFYQPFYISIAIYQFAKNYSNSKITKIYDKYFSYEKVKQLYKRINIIFKPPQAKNNFSPYPFGNNNINNICNNKNNFKNFNNTNSYENASSNVNIRKIQGKKNSHDEDDINSTYFTEKNHTPLKLKVKKNLQISNNSSNNAIRSYPKFSNNSKIYDTEMKNKTIKNNNINFVNYPNIHTTNNIENNEYNYNPNKIISVKKVLDSRIQHKSILFNKNSDFMEINPLYLERRTERYGNRSSRNIFYRNNVIEKNSLVTTSSELNNHFMCTNNFKMNRNNSIGDTKRYHNSKQKNIFENNKNKIMHPVKSSLNLQLVSGVSKEKLFKLSKNLSRRVIKTNKEKLSIVTG